MGKSKKCLEYFYSQQFLICFNQNMKIKSIIIFLIFLSPLVCIPIEAKIFKLASYNVENLFDLIENGSEYMEYIPNTKYDWNSETFNIKINNIAKVIRDLNADVVMLQEIESKKSLLSLRKRLKDLHIDYPYFEIADSKPITLKCAVLSKLRIIKKEEINVGNKFTRNILKVTLKVDSNPFILYINHWKSKKNPESARVVYAMRLKKDIDRLGDDVDFILAGDFNSSYDEYILLKNSPKLNDTNGVTGINHILGTILDSKMVSEDLLISKTSCGHLYNLWLEVKERRRWSYNFFGKKGSLDNLIIARSLYDDKGISYIDNSFNKFDPEYLFRKKTVYRWQRAKNGKGKHLGEGYSDHLPIFAYFSSNH